MTKHSALHALPLRHYRRTPIDFDRTRTYTPQDRLTEFAKPRGLWVSVEGEQDWPAWVREETPSRGAFLTVCHEVLLSASADIRLITNVEEIDAFHQRYAAPSDLDLRYGYGPEYWGIDWSVVMRRYDGIVITPYLWDRRLDGGTSWYYTWDCASGCIWNLGAIESVTAVAEVAR